MKFEATIKYKRGKDTGQFISKQAAMEWARERNASNLTIVETVAPDEKRIVFSGRPTA